MERAPQCPLFERGQRLFMNSAGVATLVDFAARSAEGRPEPLSEQNGTAAFYVLKADEVVACVPIDAAEQSLRPLSAPEVASQMLAILRGEEAPPPPSTRPILERGRDVVHQGGALEQARLLRELYGLPVPVNEAFRAGIDFVGRLVLGEIAAVLNVPRAELESEMSDRYPAEVSLRPRT